MPWIQVRVPASSANLGPGFDAMGLALDLHLTCRFRASERLLITASGIDTQDIPLDDNNLIWRTALEVAARVDSQLAPIELTINNCIPLGKGMGSSAAALTAGVIIADHLLELRWKPARILDEAARIEGHPDNVAACVLGSIVASAIDAGGVAHAVRIELPAAFEVAVVVPDFVLLTSKARAVLPGGYDKADAVFNVQRAALLMAALAAGDRHAFPTALEDRMHQPYRCGLVPGLADILKLRAPGLLGCALSGAGPSVLVFHERGYEDVCGLVRQIFAAHGCNSEVMASRVARRGYEKSVIDSTD
jgi:homoserine kinase